MNSGVRCFSGSFRFIAFHRAGPLRAGVTLTRVWSEFARIQRVDNLNATLIRDFTRYYREARDKVHALVNTLSDEQIWERPYPYGNSIGHLLLHLTGNLSYYIGAEIGGTGYKRNRPLEFADSARYPKTLVLQGFDAAISVVIATLQQQTESDWAALFSGKGMEDAGDRFTAFVRCAGHLSHHTGQIMYLCKQLATGK